MGTGGTWRLALRDFSQWNVILTRKGEEGFSSTLHWLDVVTKDSGSTPHSSQQRLLRSQALPPSWCPLRPLWCSTFHWSQNTFLPHSQYLFQFPVFTGVRPCQGASHLAFVMGPLISQQNTNLWFKKAILICSFSFPLTLKKSLQLNKKWSTHFYIFISINTDVHSHSLAHTYNKLYSPPSLLSQWVVCLHSLQCYCQLFCKQPLLFECQQNPYVCSFPLPSTISWTSTGLLIFLYVFSMASLTCLNVFSYSILQQWKKHGFGD